MPDLNSKIEAAKEKVKTLKQKIASQQASKRDVSLPEAADSIGAARDHPSVRNVKLRRTLKGHFGKVTAMHWGGDSTHVVSASQDGNLLLWNARTSNKIRSIPLKSSYVMSVGMEQSAGNLIACGGLDNMCTVYRDGTVATELASHDGFLSCCRFLSTTSLLSASGDSTVLKWDLNRPDPVSSFAEHSADVMFLSIQPGSSDVFLSCSVDRSVKLWDLRSGANSQLTLSDVHQDDINAVEYIPSQSSLIATASADNTLALWDVRSACNQLARFGTPHQESQDPLEQGLAEGFTSVAASASGRVICGGHSSGTIVAYDSISSAGPPAFVLANAHERHVSCVGISPASDALCTASWDGLLKVWA